METCADIRGSFWLINKMARVTVMTPILLMFCAKTHLMEELAAFIRYVTWLDSDTFIGFMQCLKQHMDSDLWQALALAVFGLGNIQNVNRYSFFPPYFLFSPVLSVCSGYGFVDFDSPAAAQKAVASLKASGVQAQMAKVSPPPPALLVVIEVFFLAALSSRWTQSLSGEGLAVLAGTIKMGLMADVRSK